MTMVLFLVGVGLLLVVLMAFQTLMILTYRRRVMRWDSRVDPSLTPRVGIVLSVRGFDPSLLDCLRGLATQQYAGEFAVFVIVDHEQDPAYREVERWIGEAGSGIAACDFYLRVADKPSGTCSLKCDRVARAIGGIPEKFDVVCLIDADAVPDSCWLSDLIGEFEQDQVAAVSAVRWFLPPDAGWGSMLRYAWNSAAIPQMVIYGIPWGGSLALRRDAIRETDLVGVWSQSLFEDVLVHDWYRERGLKTRSAAGLFVVNREETSWGSAITWVHRQLLDARLYHSKWHLVLAHAMGSSLLGLLLLGGIVGAAVATNATWLLISIALSLLFYLGNFCLLLILEHVAVRAVRQRLARCGLGEYSGLSARQYARLFQLVLPLQAVFFYAALKAAWTTRVSWRQAHYQVRGPRDIQLTGYQPFVAAGSPDSDAAPAGSIN